MTIRDQQTEGTPVASLVVSAINAVQLNQITGYFARNSTTPDNIFLQIHEAASLPANNAVPVWSRVVIGDFDFFFDLQGQRFQPCLLALSTTEATLTAPTDAADLASFYLTNIVEETGVENPGTVSAQAIDGGGTLATVFANASPARFLNKLTVAVPTGHTFVHLFTHDSPQQGDVPWKSFPVTEAATAILDFGVGGLLVQEVLSDNTIRRGCYVGVSNQSNSFTPDGNVGHTGTVAAVFTPAS